MHQTLTPVNQRIARLRRRPRRRTTFAVAVLVACAAIVPAGSQADSAAAAGGVVVNGGFESSTTGWYGSTGSRLSLAAGHSGNASGRLTNTAIGQATVALNDTQNTVTSTVKGSTYIASAWVRVTSPAPTVGIRLMEYGGSALYGQQRGVVVANDNTWRKVSVTYTAVTSGASLDLNVLGWYLPSGASLDVDEVVLTLGTAAPVPVASTGWRQVWADEFDTSSVDLAKWRIRNNERHSNEMACLTNRSQNVSQVGGLLLIKAQREYYPCAGYNAAWTSGYLDTVGKKSWTYGRFEMRAKLPTQPNTSKGMWPAFWLRPNDGGNGEIDVMEAIGSGVGETNYNRVSQTLWYDYYGTHPRQNYSAVMVGTNMSDGFHTYATEWEYDAIRWYIDGRLTWQRDRTDISWISSAVLAKPYNIRLNMQVGGSWPGSPNSSTASPSSYQVDYIRVFQR